MALVSSIRWNTFCFFNRQGLPFLPVGFFFVINSTFNLGPGVIACTTGVIINIFFAFFRRARASAKRARSFVPRRACLALLVRLALAFAPYKFSNLLQWLKITHNITAIYQRISIADPPLALDFFGHSHKMDEAAGNAVEEIQSHPPAEVSVTRQSPAESMVQALVRCQKVCFKYPFTSNCKQASFLKENSLQCRRILILWHRKIWE